MYIYIYIWFSNKKIIIILMLLEGGGARGSDPRWDGGSEETGSQADVRRAGTPLSGLEPQTETGRSTGNTDTGGVDSSFIHNSTNRCFHQGRCCGLKGAGVAGVSGTEGVLFSLVSCLSLTLLALEFTLISDSTRCDVDFFLPTVYNRKICILLMFGVPEFSSAL